MNDFGFIMCGLAAMLLAAIIFACGFGAGGSFVRQEAIQHHSAHYAVTNEMTGATEFQWNQPK